jgi:hypothetical protein
MTKLPGGALLITIGLLLLWLATTGRLDRVKAIWPFLSGATDVPGGVASSGGAVGTSSGISSMLPSVFHNGSMIAALTPTVKV